MSASSTFGALVNSLNLFVDTSESQHEGDSANIHLHGQSLQCDDGQVFKLCVTEFTMLRSHYTVNATNNRFQLVTKMAASPTTITTELVLPPQNYATQFEIATQFGSLVAASLATLTSVAVSTTAINAPIATYPETGDGLLDVLFTFASNHGLQVCEIRCLIADSDSYILLGGDHVASNATPSSSLNVTFPSATTVSITGRYPMHTVTDPNMYLRTDLRSTNIEMASLSAARGPFDGHTLSSNVLAKIPLQREVISMVASGPHDEFFVFLPQKSISTLRLYLTDHKGRPLGRPYGSASKTAAGTGAAQSLTGSLHFSATLRLDVIQRTPPHHLHTRPIPRRINPKDSNPVLSEYLEPL